MRQIEKVESLFNEKASSWSEKYQPDGRLLPRLAAFAERVGRLMPPPARVLDFGCGSGNLARHLSALEYSVTGCDVAAEMVRRAQEENASSSVDWYILRAHWQNLPFDSGR